MRDSLNLLEIKVGSHFKLKESSVNMKVLKFNVNYFVFLGFFSIGKNGEFKNCFLKTMNSFIILGFLIVTILVPSVAYICQNISDLKSTANTYLYLLGISSIVFTYIFTGVNVKNEICLLEEFRSFIDKCIFLKNMLHLDRYLNKISINFPLQVKMATRLKFMKKPKKDVDF